VGHAEGLDAVTVFRPNYCSMTRFQAADNQLKLIERGQELDTRVL
ncbi:MAG: histidine phosphatase family protein, partial [Alphaproteobacteria bacterium]|nr:histidine phosphatase family protein [Alphaproteobacteria bacterium]